MKQRYTSWLPCIFLLFALPAFAQHYNISQDRTWSNTVGTPTCTGCTFTITGGGAVENAISFTIDQDITCTGCSFYLTAFSRLVISGHAVTFETTSDEPTTPPDPSYPASPNNNAINLADHYPSIVIDNNAVLNFTGGHSFQFLTVFASEPQLNSFTNSTFNISGGTKLSFKTAFNSRELNTFSGVTFNLTGGSAVDASAGGDNTVTDSLTSNFTNSSFFIHDNSALSLNLYSGLFSTQPGKIPNNVFNFTNSQIVLGDVNSTSSTAALFVYEDGAINLNDAASPTGSSIRLGNIANTIQLQTATDGGTSGIIYRNNTANNRDIFISGNSLLTTPPELFSYSNNTQFVTGPSISASTADDIAATGNSTFALISPLPINLSNFLVKLTESKTVDLSWTTQQEINESHFVVQRSADGSHWATIGNVQAKGNTSIATNYAFMDQSPIVGVNYYRVQAITLDGKYQFSLIRLISTFTSKGIHIFPNPARSFVNVSITEAAADLDIKLISLSGQTLQQTSVSKGVTTILNIPVSRYAQGTYGIIIRGSDGSMTINKVDVIH